METRATSLQKEGSSSSVCISVTDIDKSEDLNSGEQDPVDVKIAEQDCGVSGKKMMTNKEETAKEDTVVKGEATGKKYAGSFHISRPEDTTEVHQDNSDSPLRKEPLTVGVSQEQDEPPQEKKPARSCPEKSHERVSSVDTFDDGLSSEKCAYASSRTSFKAGYSSCDDDEPANQIMDFMMDQSLIEVMPLPGSGEDMHTLRGIPKGPGAHPVNSRHPEVSPRPPREPREQVDPMVHEAVVCSEHSGVEGETQVMPDPSASSNGYDYDATEYGRVSIRATDEVVDAKILPEGGNKRNRKWGWFILLCVLLVGLAVILPALLIPTPKSNGEDNINQTDPDLAEAPHPLFPPFQENLPTAMVKFIEDPDHPHSFANSWIWQDPHKDTYTRERQIQRFHLASFYSSTHGEDWFRNDDWLSYEVSECQWFSQHHNDTIPHYDDYPICDEDDNLLVLNLASNNLRGDFPLVRNFITTLRTYDVSDNHIGGKLPSASTPDMEVFIVSNNKFEGLIIGDVGSFSSFDLRVIKMDGNNLYGKHDALFAILGHLEILDISGNYFSGEIPSRAKMCKNLTQLSIADNKFEGTIPTELAMLAKLQELDVSGNAEVIGTIPSELGLITSLVHLDISGTEVSGEVPPSLCTAIEVEALDLVADCGTSLKCCGQ